MAEINVKRVNIENGGNQILGDPFTVTVVVNNREMLAPAPWKSTRCMSDFADNGEEEAGHGATVEVELLKNGATIETQESQVCTPPDGSGYADPRPAFEFDPDETGIYDLRATVTPKGHGPTDTETYTIEVSDTGEQDAPNSDNGGDGDGGDDSSGLPAFGDADNDGHRNFVDPEPQNPDVPGDGPMQQLDKAMLLVALLIVAWLASSASTTVEAVT